MRQDTQASTERAAEWTGHTLRHRLKRCVYVLCGQEAIQEKTRDRLLNNVDDFIHENPPVEDWTGRNMDERLVWATCFLFAHRVADVKDRFNLFKTLRARGIDVDQYVRSEW